MDTSLAWLYEHEEEYRKRTGQPLWSISDWHNDPGDLVLPSTLLSTLNVDANAITRYRFLDTVRDTKHQIVSFYRECCAIELPNDSLTICQNGTAALNLIIKSLVDDCVRRILVVTPAYFSLLSVSNLYRLNTVYAHADLLEDLDVNADRVLKVAQEQMVDAIFLTNPVFSTGTALSLDSLQCLAYHVEHTGKWLILDETLAGLPWHFDCQYPFVTSAMKLLMTHSRCIYLWSVSKALFLNGLKHALVFAPPRITKKIERAADLLVGGLTATQIALIEQIYCQSSKTSLQECARQNVAQFSATYDLCATCLYGTTFQLTSVDIGFHTVAFIPKKQKNSSIHAREIACAMIDQHGVSAIPLAHFGFPPFSPIGFRINLSKNPGRLHDGLAVLVEITNKYPYLSH